MLIFEVEYLQFIAIKVLIFSRGEVIKDLNMNWKVLARNYSFLLQSLKNATFDFFPPKISIFKVEVKMSDILRVLSTMTWAQIEKSSPEIVNNYFLQSLKNDPSDCISVICTKYLFSSKSKSRNNSVQVL